MPERRCPSGFRWSEELNVCIQETVRTKTSGTHFFRNILLFFVGFFFGLFSLWSWGWSIGGFSILLILFLLMLGYLFFADSTALKYPIIGFVIGIIISYWSYISGILKFVGIGG